MKELTSKNLYDIVKNPKKPHIAVQTNMVCWEAYSFGGQQFVFRFLRGKFNPGTAVDPQLISLCPSGLDALGIMHQDWIDFAEDNSAKKNVLEDQARIESQGSKPHTGTQTENAVEGDY